MAKTADDLVSAALDLREEDMAEDERRLLAERLTEGGRFWTRQAIVLVREAKRCRGSRARSARLEYLAMARSCFKSALDADKPAELVEVRRLAELLEEAKSRASDIDHLE